MFALLAAVLLHAATPLAPLPHSPDLYVSGFFSSSVQRFYGPRSANSGARPVTGLSDAFYVRPVARRPWGLAFGPDGNLYVANYGNGSEAIVRVQGPFSTNAGQASIVVDAGRFFDVAFGPDGNLYASGNGPVLRYDIVTGALLGEFTHGYTLHDARAMAFGPDGNLYIAHYDDCVTGPNGCTGSLGEIVRFDGLTGDFLDVYVHSGQGGLMWPYDLAFGPGGALFVANTTATTNNILRFDRSARVRAIRNAASAVFVTHPGLYPLAIAFGPDYNLYVSSNSDNSGSDGAILRFDGRTGAFIDVYVASVEGGPRGIAFGVGAR